MPSFPLLSRLSGARAVSGRDGLPFLILLVACLYWPGLSGDYLLDDGRNILENRAVALAALTPASLRDAALSGDAGPLKRPVAMLTFALNHYAVGSFAPYTFKLTNLLIHLCNTLLVYFLAFRLLLFAAGRENEPETPDGTRARHLGALFAAALWGLAPINLSPVLYVVQRMTSLSALFGFAALLCYCRLRMEGSALPFARRAAWCGAMAALLLLSLFSKESGILFLPFALWIELFLFRGRDRGENGRFLERPLRLRRLWQCAGAAAAIGLIGIVSMRPDTWYAGREFTLSERLFTEARILFYYLRLFFAPELAEFSLFHDDFSRSAGLLRPPATLFALLGLAAISAFTFWLFWKKGRRLWLFVWGWFLLGHALESTFIPLELIYEHRNYAAIFGFCLIPSAAFGGFWPRGRRRILWIAAFLLLGGSAWVTGQRAWLWGNLAEQARYEALHHPESSRANYQLARIYTRRLDKTGEARYEELTRIYSEKAAGLPDADSGGLFTLMFLAYRKEQIPDAALFARLTRYFSERLPHGSDMAYLSAYIHCVGEGGCKTPETPVKTLLEAARNAPRGTFMTRKEAAKISALYYANVLGERETAIGFLDAAIAESGDFDARMLRVKLYTAERNFDAADADLVILEKMDTSGRRAADIRGLTRQNRAAREAAAQSATDSAP
ncbi:MAG: hypothetical protein LBG69_08125 [Zoogloeaceae bacterium]|nr:hypothetical protein [Zoogloeaceae bacterium]